MQRGGDPLILCFVDFANAACAATAMSALQGDRFCLSSFMTVTSVGRIRVYHVMINY